MRATDIPRIAEWWFVILTSPLLQSNPEVVASCLKVMTVFAVWIEIRIIANEKFIDKLFELVVNNGSPSAFYSPAACECLAAILHKGMEAKFKLELLQHCRVEENFEKYFDAKMF